MWRGGRHGWCNGAIFMTAQVVVRLSDILLAVSAVCSSVRHGLPFYVSVAGLPLSPSSVANT